MFWSVDIYFWNSDNLFLEYGIFILVGVWRHAVEKYEILRIGF